ncbi:hypothetical protein [Bacillus sp. S/N-304-OC-R1]|uniref:hypothetical protein n=1 Tax=Bacillus sp. S/N-304-OC-R1 TaxID=2758034 RepID=UPI001C8EA00E|nr:hypothetical protein [Bacillus sp. S/N-304-OC-R1]MBY0121177.1 hypothetical protein [Bacillus sp. S/N-304-OC-R1]
MDKEKQNNDSVKVDPFLKWHLDSDQFDVPDIPLKKNKIDRFFRYLGSPANNPFERYINHAGNLTVLAISPILLGFIFFLLQFIKVSL